MKVVLAGAYGNLGADIYRKEILQPDSRSSAG